MPRRHAIAKWIRIATACALAVAGGAGILVSLRAGLAQERYFRYKYGHFNGTSKEVPAVDFTVPGADRSRLPEVLDACEIAHVRYPKNYYFPSYASHQALIAALMDDDPVAFRRHFGSAEHWNRIAYALNPYDIEVCYIRCRILWEKGDRKGAIAFWRDTVVAREFWNPDLRAHLVDLCRRAGDNSLAIREARFLWNGTSTVRSLEKLQTRRSAVQP